MHHDKTDAEKIKFIFGRLRELKYLVPENLGNHIDIAISRKGGDTELRYAITSNLRNVESLSAKIHQTILAAAREVDIFKISQKRIG